MTAMIDAVSIRQESFRELPRPVANLGSTQSAAYMIPHSGWIGIREPQCSKNSKAPRVDTAQIVLSEAGYPVGR